MRSFKTKIYFHREKEENNNVEDKMKRLGFKISDDIKYSESEIVMEVEIFEDGTNKIVKIEGIDVSNLDMYI